MNSNPALGIIGFWMLLQLAATLAILLGGIYALFCLGRAASGLDRMASALEEWVARQQKSTPPVLPTPVQAAKFIPAAAVPPFSTEHSPSDESTA